MTAVIMCDLFNAVNLMGTCVQFFSDGMYKFGIRTILSNVCTEITAQLSISFLCNAYRHWNGAYNCISGYTGIFTFFIKLIL